MTTTRMPRGAARLLAWAVPPQRLADIVGDLEEEANALQRSAALLWWWYWMHAVRIAARFAPSRRRWANRGGAIRQPDGVMAAFARDMRFAARGMVRRPGFTLVAAVTLALGIGASTAIFSVVHAVLLNPMPYPEANRVGILYQRNLSRGAERDLVAPGNFIDWRRQTSEIFDHIAAISPWGLDYLGDGQAEVIPAALVTRGFFEALGARMHLGRSFVAEDYGPSGDDTRGGRANILVFTYEFWQSRFGADSSIIGSTVRFSDTPFTIVGVLEPEFSSPVYSGRDIYAPLNFWAGADEDRRSAYLGAVARVRRDVSLEQASRTLQLIGSRLAAEHPRENTGVDISWVPVREQLVGRVERPLLILLGAVAAVLLIACANIANLLLARGSERRGEFALRVALGAPRGRLVRQLLTESLLLAAVGSLAGLLLAHWGTKLVLALAPAGIPRLADAGLNVPVVLFAFAVTMLTAVLIGLMPAWSATQTSVNATLRESGPATSAGGTQHRLRGAFTISQVALAMVLLLGSGLLVRSFRYLLGRDLGFNPERVVALQVYNWVRYPEAEGRIAYFEQALAAVRAVPGVLGASVAQAPPLHPDYPAVQVAREDEATTTESLTAWGSIAAPEYFHVMGIPILAGREFAATDGPGAPPVAIVTQSLARRLWGDQSPLGRRFVATASTGAVTMEVIGVAADFRHTALAERARPTYFQPHAQNPTGAMVFVVRTAADPAASLETIKNAIWSVNANQPFYAIATMEELVSRALSQQRFAMVLLTVFAALAGVLAAIGTYGVMSYVTSQRSKEIGIRVAMGARPRRVLWEVSRQGIVWISAGVGLGLVLAFVATRALRTLLYGVTPADPLTFVAGSLLLFLTALVATVAATRRAARVDPVAALRG